MRLMVAVMVVALCSAYAAAQEMVDLTKAVVLTPVESNKQERKAAVMLVEEIARRTQIRPVIAHSPPAQIAPLIVLGTGEGLKALNPNSKIPAPAGIEGFHIWIDDTG